MSNLFRMFLVPWILVGTILALARCGGGDSQPAPLATVTGSVSGTVVLAVDETGAIAAKDDTIGKTPVDNTVPARYPFTLTMRPGHRYVFYFIVGEGTPSERIVPLYSGHVNIFRIDPPDLPASIDLGFVDTAGDQAAAQHDPLSHPHVKDGGTSGPRTIRFAGDSGVPGIRFFNFLDLPDGARRYRTHVQAYDASGAPLSDGALVKGMAVYDNTWQELPLDGSHLFWNGSEVSIDSTGVVVPFPITDIEAYLSAAPGAVPAGFYTVAVTDNNLNLYTSKLYHGAPVEVAKPTELVSTPNPDNSITLSWTPPPGLSASDYLIYAHVASDDRNGDGYTDSDSLLFVIRDASATSYTIPAEYVQAVLRGKPNLRWTVQARQRTPEPIEFPDGSLSVAQFYRNYSAEAPLSLPAFQDFIQADLEGAWDFVQFSSGQDAGWARGTVSIDSAGNASFSAYLDSGGGTTPPAGPIVAAVDGSGVVTQTVGGAPTLFHGNMSESRELIVATEPSDSTTISLHVARKRTGTPFSNADIASKTFTLHDLSSGSDDSWEYGTGSTDASGQLTISTLETPFGTAPDLPYVNVDTISVDGAGTVSSLDPTFGGFMTNDKQAVFLTSTFDSTPPANHGMIVILLSGQTFTQADLAGIYDFHSLRNAPIPGWAYGTFSVDSSGAGSYLSYADSGGGTTAPPFVRTLGPDGVVLDPADPSYHGQLSFGADLYIRTNTNAFGYYGIALAVR